MLDYWYHSQVDTGFATPPKIMATGSDMVAHPVKKRRGGRKSKDKKAEKIERPHVQFTARITTVSHDGPQRGVRSLSRRLRIQLFSHELVWMFVSTRMLTEFSVKAVYPI